jgi:hypothetical protein
MLSSRLQVHHILYLFAELGDRETTETAVRRVLEKGYGTDFFAGESERGMHVSGESCDRGGQISCASVRLLILSV